MYINNPDLNLFKNEKPFYIIGRHHHIPTFDKPVVNSFIAAKKKNLYLKQFCKDRNRGQGFRSELVYCTSH